MASHHQSMRTPRRARRGAASWCWRRAPTADSSAFRGASLLLLLRLQMHDALSSPDAVAAWFMQTGGDGAGGDRECAGGDAALRAHVPLPHGHGERQVRYTGICVDLHSSDTLPLTSCARVCSPPRRAATTISAAAMRLRLSSRQQQSASSNGAAFEPHTCWSRILNRIHVSRIVLFVTRHRLARTWKAKRE